MLKSSIIILSLLTMFISSCATTGTLKDTWEKAPHRTKSEIFDYPMEDVYEAGRQACLNLGLAVDSSEKTKEGGAIYAKTGVNIGKIFCFGTGYGEMIGIFLTKVSDNSTKVDTVIQKAYKLDVGYKDYRGLILDQIRIVLKAKR